MPLNKVRAKKIIRDILGGDDLLSDGIISRHWPLICYAVLLCIVFIANRYAAECELIKVNNLCTERDDIVYQELSIRAKYMERCRLSIIEQELIEQGEAVRITTRPRYSMKK